MAVPCLPAGCITGCMGACMFVSTSVQGPQSFLAHFHVYVYRHTCKPAERERERETGRVRVTGGGVEEPVHMWLHVRTGRPWCCTLDVGLQHPRPSHSDALTQAPRGGQKVKTKTRQLLLKFCTGTQSPYGVEAPCPHYAPAI